MFERPCVELYVHTDLFQASLSQVALIRGLAEVLRAFGAILNEGRWAEEKTEMRGRYTYLSLAPESGGIAVIATGARNNIEVARLHVADRHR